MKNHTKTACVHFALAGCWAMPLGVLLAVAALRGNEIGWLLPGSGAALAAAHLLMGWGAWRAHNWARVLTLALAFLALLAVPLGTLLAILLISCCWPAWERRGASPVAARMPATAT